MVIYIIIKAHITANIIIQTTLNDNKKEKCQSNRSKRRRAKYRNSQSIRVIGQWRKFDTFEWTFMPPCTRKAENSNRSC